jgi:hypothetical protein
MIVGLISLVAVAIDHEIQNKRKQEKDDEEWK